MTHKAVYPFNPELGPAVCGSPNGARGTVIGSLLMEKPADCPDCLRILAEEAEAVRAEMRAFFDKLGAAESVAQALFGWLEFAWSSAC